MREIGISRVDNGHNANVVFLTKRNAELFRR